MKPASLKSFTPPVVRTLTLGTVRYATARQVQPGAVTLPVVVLLITLSVTSAM
jgi:hypothetical protein